MTRLALGLLLAGLSLPAAAVAQSGAVAFHDVRVFDGERVVERAVVVVLDGRIAAVGSDVPIPYGARIVEGEGRTLLPGLIDAHTHTFDPANLRQALVLGVTTQLDMATSADLAARLRAERAAGGAERADLFSSGPPITAPGGHGTQFGMDFDPVAGPAEARERVAAFAAAGADWIKIIRDEGRAWGMAWPTVSDETIAAAVEAAHAAGLLAVVHPGSFDDARRAVELGADGIVHVPLDRAPAADFGRVLAEAGAFTIPTLTVFEGGAPDLAADPRIGPFLDPETRANLGRGLPRGPGTDFRHALEAVRLLHAAGARILAGSDAANPGTAYGASLHRELELLVEGGLPPIEALRAATAAPADAFGLDDHGRIAPGRRADLVLVEGDPTADVTATRAIAGVWKGGVEVERDAFRAEVAERLAAAEARAAEPPPPGSESGWIADFDDSAPSARFGQGWVVSTDAMMGGQSSAQIAVVDGGAEGTPGALGISGAIHPGSAFRFAGAMFFPGPTPMAPVNLAGWDAISFRARGDGRTYNLLVFSRAGGMMPAGVAFETGPEWAEHVFPWSAFGTDGSDVTGIFFGASDPPGAFDLLIDQVRLE